jgi:hypothetical protein
VQFCRLLFDFVPEEGRSFVFCRDFCLAVSRAVYAFAELSTIGRKCGISRILRTHNRLWLGKPMRNGDLNAEGAENAEERTRGRQKLQNQRKRRGLTQRRKDAKAWAEGATAVAVWLAGGLVRCVFSRGGRGDLTAGSADDADEKTERRTRPCIDASAPTGRRTPPFAPTGRRTVATGGAMPLAALRNPWERSRLNTSAPKGLEEKRRGMLTVHCHASAQARTSCLTHLPAAIPYLHAPCRPIRRQAAHRRPCGRRASRPPQRSRAFLLPS